MIGQTFSHYKILEKLGSGGMGVVYKAQDTRLGRNVALKFLPGEFAQNRQALERFQREARAASALDHPNICTIHDIGEQEGQPFIVMQFLKGRTLRRYLGSGPLDQEHLIEWSIQISSALKAAHDRGIIHRDIKPDNVFVTESGPIKLLDFGLAKLVEEGPYGAPAELDTQAGGPLTAPGIGVGTPYYMSPEQLLDKDLDARSDIFSFGVLLYEMATDHMPFQGQDLGAVFQKILNEAPVSPEKLNPELSGPLGQVIQKALEKDREARYQSAKELLKDLTRLKEGGNSLARMATSSAPKVQAQPSIAVLPFVNMSPDPENEYFSDGLAEELINALTQLKGLRVASRTSAFSFKGGHESISQIGRELKVDTVLEGSVRKAGKRLRITAQLIKIADGYHLWSERYDREMEDIFDLQDEIARKIVDKLRVNFVEDSQELLVKRYTENVEAYNLYLKGRYHLNQRTEQNVLKAIDCLEQATSEDESYALPHAGLAEAYILLNIDCPQLMCDRDPVEMVSRAKQAAQKAIEVDDSCAEAHVALALVYYRLDWDWERAEQEFRLALDRNEGLATAHHQYAMFLASVSRLDEALTEIRQAHELDPLSPIISTAVGRILHFSRRFDEAIDQCQRTFELHPRFTGAHFDMGLAYLLKGMYPEAREAFKKLSEISGNPKRGLMEFAWVCGAMGEREKAFKLLDQLSELSVNENLPRIPLALVHIGLGDIEKALELLEEGYAQRDSNLLYLRCEPAFDSLRSDPRFQDLVNRMGLQRPGVFSPDYA
jgi:serine/threonine-protein kinase